jgi:hypothetical protein
MGTQTSFDLNEARRQWQQQLVAAGLTSGEIEELQNHVAEVSDDLRQRGLREEESFWVAARRLGPAPSLAAEFAAADPWRYWSERLFWAAALGLVIYFVLSSFRLVAFFHRLYLLVAGWWDHYLNGAWAAASPEWQGAGSFSLGLTLVSMLTDLVPLAVAVLFLTQLRRGQMAGWLSRRIPTTSTLVRWLTGLTICLVLSETILTFWNLWAHPLPMLNVVCGLVNILSWPGTLLTLLLACRPASDSSFGSRVSQPAKV